MAKCRDLSVSRRSIICLSLQLQQIIDLLATDKSRYFAQSRLIIANCSRRLNFSVTYRAPNLTATSKSDWIWIWNILNEFTEHFLFGYARSGSPQFRRQE